MSSTARVDLRIMLRIRTMKHGQFAPWKPLTWGISRTLKLPHARMMSPRNRVQLGVLHRSYTESWRLNAMWCYCLHSYISFAVVKSSVSNISLLGLEQYCGNSMCESFPACPQDGVWGGMVSTERLITTSKLGRSPGSSSFWEHRSIPKQFLYRCPIVAN